MKVERDDVVYMGPVALLSLFLSSLAISAVILIYKKNTKSSG